MKLIPSETNLFFVNALVEGCFGIIEFFNPSFMFYGATSYPVTFTAGRMAGAMMFTLGFISYEIAKVNSGRNAVGKAMLFYHILNVALGLYGFYTGCYLPGPVVEGVPDVLKLISNTLIHGYLAVGFSKYVRLIK